jgi:hypothetical protein
VFRESRVVAIRTTSPPELCAGFSSLSGIESMISCKLFVLTTRSKPKFGQVGGQGTHKSALVTIQCRQRFWILACSLVGLHHGVYGFIKCCQPDGIGRYDLSQDCRRCRYRPLAALVLEQAVQDFLSNWIAPTLSVHRQRGGSVAPIVRA